MLREALRHCQGEGSALADTFGLHALILTGA
jgi:hypothetical protein